MGERPWSGGPLVTYQPLPYQMAGDLQRPSEVKDYPLLTSVKGPWGPTFHKNDCNLSVFDITDSCTSFLEMHVPKGFLALFPFPLLEDS